MNKAFDTLNMLDLFNTNFNINHLIFHIPHSSNFIPDYKGYKLNSRFNIDMNLLTDWATDKIFNVKDATIIIAKFNRMFCDVERLDDDNEPMFKKGHGFFYTNNTNGNLLRTDVNNIKSKIYNDFYLKHHNKLTELTDNKLKTYNKAIIIDCHSFNDKPVRTELNQNNNRPDICIGSDDFHTPKYLLETVKNYFINLGYKVEINNPYVGTIIPLKHYLKNPNVQGIMIEINKKLYMKNDNVINDNVLKLNKIINNLFN
ncbi:MAG: N-formylglutamate amidohydrolase [Bacteroidales bacterium]|jgi:N-formylglutamate deformylase|nr:N-formylglutamate amidohydrolase [Bacteroidales bacterium]